MLRRTLQVTLLCASIAASHQAAAGLLFDFDGLPSYGNNVQNYVNSVAGAGNVTVYGAYAHRTYTGDNYVTKSGQATNPSYLQYLTLGTSDGAKSPTEFTAKSSRQNDWFITNSFNGPQSGNTPYGQEGGDKIVFLFKDPILNISFDWEVFPNAKCGTCTGGSNFPDFKLWAGDANTRFYDYHTGDALGSFPVFKPSGSNYAQGLGHFSVDFARPVTRVEFVDWPVLIGIDNLDPRRVPEPGTLALLGLAAAAVAVARRGGASA